MKRMIIEPKSDRLSSVLVYTLESSKHRLILHLQRSEFDLS